MKNTSTAIVVIAIITVILMYGLRFQDIGDKGAFINRWTGDIYGPYGKVGNIRDPNYNRTNRPK